MACAGRHRGCITRTNVHNGGVRSSVDDGDPRTKKGTPFFSIIARTFATEYVVQQPLQRGTVRGSLDGAAGGMCVHAPRGWRRTFPRRTPIAAVASGLRTEVAIGLWIVRRMRLQHLLRQC